MSFDWKSYVYLAGELINHKSSPRIQEAYLRSAISRSYYGVYGVASNFLSKRITIPRKDTHKFVRNKYIQSKNVTEKGIGNNLNRLWCERKRADYEGNVVIDIKMTETAHQLAIRMLGELNNIGAI